MSLDQVNLVILFFVLLDFGYFFFFVNYCFCFYSVLSYVFVLSIVDFDN